MGDIHQKVDFGGWRYSYPALHSLARRTGAQQYDQEDPKGVSTLRPGWRELKAHERFGTVFRRPARSGVAVLGSC